MRTSALCLLACLTASPALGQTIVGLAVDGKTSAELQIEELDEKIEELELELEGLRGTDDPSNGGHLAALRTKRDATWSGTRETIEAVRVTIPIVEQRVAELEAELGKLQSFRRFAEGTRDFFEAIRADPDEHDRIRRACNSRIPLLSTQLDSAQQRRNALNVLLESHEIFTAPSGDRPDWVEAEAEEAEAELEELEELGEHLANQLQKAQEILRLAN